MVLNAFQFQFELEFNAVISLVFPLISLQFPTQSHILEATNQVSPIEIHHH